MKEPDILSVMNELEEERRLMAHLPSNLRYGRESEHTGNRRRLHKEGPVRWAEYIESRKANSYIKQQKFLRDADGMKKAEFFTTLINGRHPFHVEIEAEINGTQLIQALFGPEKNSREEVAAALGVELKNQWSGSDYFIKHAVHYGEDMPPCPLIV